jgi:hypothetical protein
VSAVSDRDFCLVCGASAEEADDLCPLNEEADNGVAIDWWEHDNCLDFQRWKRETHAERPK